MKVLGKYIYPRQIILAAAGLMFFGATTYDVHRSIKNNHKPPSKEQIQALDDYLKSKGQSS